MDDERILDLYWSRRDEAISETAAKYGGYCYSIAFNILANREDSEESVSDTYFAAWQTIPPRRPKALAAFLGKLTRRFSISRWRQRTAKKRGGGQMPLALEELEEIAADGSGPEENCLRKELTAAIDEFLDILPEEERNIFLSRYWYLDSIDTIAAHGGFTQSKVKSSLSRTRGKLRAHLKEEGLL